MVGSNLHHTKQDKIMKFETKMKRILLRMFQLSQAHDNNIKLEVYKYLTLDERWELKKIMNCTASISAEDVINAIDGYLTDIRMNHYNCKIVGF